MPRRSSSDRKPRKGASRKNGDSSDPEGLPAEIISFLFDQLSSEERSERAWKAMFSPDREEDDWGPVEEHLLHKPSESNHRDRRWKFFGK